ncbi:hypothetical protein G6L68_25350 [Agrobacterium fabrum]|uniref:hypothetical protein n=1 Tax=Agrobacterium fabrum TaxID=1176649 RepID=UPI000EF5BFA6|nr:hypothetical protein [Agrobacterium fabrum]AYM66216.1 hypothetical protein At12D13_50640 [Agrobacterium fabrum]NTE63961.1 hypothetical protein [Agrobacterium fabrum]
MFKKFGIYVAIAAAWGLAYAAKDFFGVSDIWMAIAVIAVIALVANYSIEQRLQTLEARVVHKDYSGIIAQLEGERHVPRHQQPESLVAGGAIKSWIRPEHETLFEDFRYFGAVLNRHLADSWSVEELPRTDARGFDSPEIGRMYEVWYNACKVGRFQVTLGSGMLLRRDKSEDKRSACLELDLNYVRWVPYNDARNLLYEFVMMVGSFDMDNAEASRARAMTIAAEALGGHLWEVVRNPDLDPMFDFRIEGSYDLLRDQTDHWKAHGFDPMANGGDRDRETA